ncbi:ubiquitin-conjugating enzyme/RWD-like protein [Rhodotorula diobovata]|uniref:Ubiquitin-conjugating enzyme/RWD-like protein n=1 Tax=Rhodotorula diobovata TaxID=5288 RepID=A0A5C5G3Y9_9BASI|nr:ubiquitin-conjugating enzyme/RWD-like protein [Rhodotorula diobovata]
MASRIAAKRLQKELTELQTKGPPAGCRVLQADNLEEWIVALSVLGESVFAGEEFALRFRFSNQYPIDSPEVTFLTSDGFKPPQHPHVYTNGHICASILGSGWSPVLNVQSLLITMQSMLASCKKKELPPDNDRYVRNAPKSPKDTRWAYHDDTV